LLLGAFFFLNRSAVGQGEPYGVVSPTSVNFGQVLVGQTSPQKRVSLKNTGESELTISNISISGHFAIPVNHCGSGVRPGTHCDVYVTYTPVALETDTGTLTFTDNASNSPQTVSLTGTGATTVPTKTKATASPNSIMAGQSVTFTATVTSLGGGAIPDGEQVNFMWNNFMSLGNGTLQGGVATLTASLYWRGQDTQKVTAQYAGDQTFGPSSGVVDVGVHRWDSTVTLTTSPNPSLFREPITFTVNIASGSPDPIGGTIWAFCPPPMYVGVGDGVATESCVLKQDAGSYVFGAQYRGDGYDLPGESSGYTQVINASPTTATLKSSKNPSHQGQQVTFSAVIKAEYGKDYLSGSVTFTSGGITLGTAELEHGRAAITTSSLPAGQDTITATYTPANGNFVGSSASLVQTVE
jgi:hypothetical protein